MLHSLLSKTEQIKTEQIKENEANTAANKENTWFRKYFLTVLISTLFAICGALILMIHSSDMEALNKISKDFDTISKQLNSHETRITVMESDNKTLRSTLDEVRKDVKDQKQTLDDLKADVRVIKTLLLKGTP